MNAQIVNTRGGIRIHRQCIAWQTKTLYSDGKTVFFFFFLSSTAQSCVHFYWCFTRLHFISWFWWKCRNNILGISVRILDFRMSILGIKSGPMERSVTNKATRRNYRIKRMCVTTIYFNFMYVWTSHSLKLNKTKNYYDQDAKTIHKINLFFVLCTLTSKYKHTYFCLFLQWFSKLQNEPLVATKSGWTPILIY